MEEGCIVQLEIIDGGDLNLVEPFYSFAVFPKAKLGFTIFGNEVGTNAVLFTFEPVAFIATTIGPRVDSEAMLFVIFVFALVHSAIVPNVNAHTFHVVLEPLTFIATAI